MTVFLFSTTGSFEPFSDVLLEQKEKTSGSVPNTDTSAIDRYRQGIELQTRAQLYETIQPKIWGGTVSYTGKLNHQQDYWALGQAKDFTSVEGQTTFTDNPEFNPVLYLNLGVQYPYPILFNGGLQEQQQAIIEVVKTPFRFPSLTNFSDEATAKGFDWNQYVSFYSPVATSSFTAFLDQGTVVLASASVDYQLSEKTTTEAYTDAINVTSTKYDSLDESFKTAMSYLSASSDDGFLPYKKKSTNTGACGLYGMNIQKYGTDSIAFIGRARGSS